MDKINKFETESLKLASMWNNKKSANYLAHYLKKDIFGLHSIFTCNVLLEYMNLSHRAKGLFFEEKYIIWPIMETFY